MSTDTKDFWDSVKKLSPKGCWLWTGAKVGKYGACRRTAGENRAHRAAWALANGPIPKGLFVCHRCDNPPCVNPGHLFLGTVYDNNADMVAKGRNVGPKGEIQHRAAVTEQDVLAIRAAALEGVGQRALARKYGVSQNCIWHILKRKTWTHLPDAAARSSAKGEGQDG